PLLGLADVDAAAVEVDHLPGDVQPQIRAAAIGTEGREDLVEFGLREVETAVDDPQASLALPRANRDDDLPALPFGTDAPLEEVHEGFDQPVPVAAHEDLSLGDLEPRL